jgi:histidine triad (HIT) family protein
MTESQDCVFCKIVRGEFGTEFLAESENAVAFNDIQPLAPTHALVVPRRHIVSLNDLTSEDKQLAGELVLLAAEVARRLNVDAAGYRVVSNVGENGGQSVSHLHFHVLGGRRLSAGLA